MNNTLTTVIPCPTCKTALKEVVQDSHSLLNSDQFDALKPGDWYCETCAPDEGHNYKYWRNSQVLIQKSTIDEVTPAFIESLECAFVDGCVELGMDLYKLNKSTIKILQSVWNKARHNIPPESGPAELMAMLHLQGTINQMCGTSLAGQTLALEIFHVVITSKLVRADYKALYEGMEKT